MVNTSLELIKTIKNDSIRNYLLSIADKYIVAGWEEDWTKFKIISNEDDKLIAAQVDNDIDDGVELVRSYTIVDGKVIIKILETNKITTK